MDFIEYITPRIFEYFSPRNPVKRIPIGIQIADLCTLLDILRTEATMGKPKCFMNKVGFLYALSRTNIIECVELIFDKKWKPRNIEYLLAKIIFIYFLWHFKYFIRYFDKRELQIPLWLRGLLKVYKQKCSDEKSGNIEKRIYDIIETLQIVLDEFKIDDNDLRDFINDVINDLKQIAQTGTIDGVLLQ